jgi:hypothetical protein
MYGVGVGKADMKELTEIAGSENRTFLAENYNKLEEIEKVRKSYLKYNFRTAIVNYANKIIFCFSKEFLQASVQNNHGEPPVGKDSQNFSRSYGSNNLCRNLRPDNHLPSSGK